MVVPRTRCCGVALGRGGCWLAFRKYGCKGTGVQKRAITLSVFVASLVFLLGVPFDVLC